MFISYNKVRMHDTDMAGLLYFTKQFRFAHDALEDFVESQGFDFDQLFNRENFVFVIVHCESDYYAPLAVSDRLEIHLSLEHIGTTSFTMTYQIFKEKEKTLVGFVKTVHVCLERISRKKIEVPAHFKTKLEEFLVKSKPVN